MCDNKEQKKIVLGAEQKEIEPKCYEESSHALILTINNVQVFYPLF